MRVPKPANSARAHSGEYKEMTDELIYTIRQVARKMVKQNLLKAGTVAGPDTPVSYLCARLFEFIRIHILDTDSLVKMKVWSVSKSGQSGIALSSGGFCSGGLNFYRTLTKAKKVTGCETFGCYEADQWQIWPRRDGRLPNKWVVGQTIKLREALLEYIHREIACEADMGFGKGTELAMGLLFECALRFRARLVASGRSVHDILHFQPGKELLNDALIKGLWEL